MELRAHSEAVVTDFYEEMADFAAMSEDDGFLGQCAGERADVGPPSNQQANLELATPPNSCCGPRQLQLLVIASPATNRPA
jgi:hypothetical protein